jgi:hypothetical protein
VTPTKEMLANNPDGYMYNVGMTEAELTELVLLIDDEAVDEEMLAGIRRKLVHKRKQLRRRKANAGALASRSSCS